MAPGQSSFRRILLSRILLVSVPVLLVGVYVTYRKARSAFLETARQNLTESAIRKGESLNCDAKLGYYGMAACKMGVLSFRKRQYLKWDEKKQKPVKA